MTGDFWFNIVDVKFEDVGNGAYIPEASIMRQWCKVWKCVNDACHYLRTHFYGWIGTEGPFQTPEFDKKYF